jgi:NarL family two-component system response regulator LiaR
LPDSDGAISLLIVDDHELVRRGMRAFFEAQPDLVVVGEADSGARAIDLALEYLPQVAFVDLIMPEMDGVEVTRQIKKVSPATQIIVLTSYHDDEHIFPALRAGALSYLLKDISPEELSDAARRAVRGEAVLHPRIAARLVQDLRSARGEVPNLFVELTEREMEVLRHIADGRSNAEIGSQLFISEKTVKRHVSNILSKLQLRDRTQAAALAWREGLVRRS